MGIIFKRWLLSTFWSIFFQSLFLCLFLVFGFYIVVLHCHTQTHLYYPFSCLCKARVYWKYMEVWPNHPRRFPRNFPGNQNKWLYKQKRNNLWLVLDFFLLFLWLVVSLRVSLDSGISKVNSPGLNWRSRAPVPELHGLVQIPTLLLTHGVSLGKFPHLYSGDYKTSFLITVARIMWQHGEYT